MFVRPKREFPELLFRVRGSALATIWPLLVAVALWSTLMTWAHARYGWLDLTATPFSIIGLALSIFLGFRNSSCYDRWWEARKLWGGLVNTTRTYSRQTLTLVRGPGDQARPWQEEAVRRMVAYTHALRIHLRSTEAWDELAPFLAADELEDLRRWRNKPIALLHTLGERHREAFERGWVDSYHLAVLERTLGTLTDIQGACERIKNTPVPLSYTELTHRIVALYVLFLPLGLVGTTEHLTPLVVVLVAYCFLGLDAVGSQIENPFDEDPNDLPLGQLSRMIENDLLQRIGVADLRPDMVPVDDILT